MALTRDFRETVKEELTNVEFRRAFLAEAVRSMVAGDLESAKVTLREFINGTIGFPSLGAALGRSPKSLMRMLSPTGNPQARNLLDMLAYLQKTEGAVLEVRVRDSVAA